MKGFSCVLIVATVQLGQVSSFVAPSLAPVAALRLPLAARCLHNAHFLCSSGGSRRANIWVQSLSAEVDHGSHNKETTVARSITVWHRLADLVRAVVVQAAMLVSFFVLSPVITLATTGWQASADASVEAPAPSARCLQPKRVVWLATVVPMDALCESRAANAAAQEKARLSSKLELEDLSILEQAEDLSELRDFSILEQAENLSTERKKWLYSPQARKMGMLLVSAASLTMNLNTADSALFAKAQEQAQQQEANAANSHDTADASVLASSVPTQMGPNVQHFVAKMGPKSHHFVAGMGPTVQDLEAETQQSAETQQEEEVAKKSWSVFRNPDAELAAEATPATLEDEMHKKYPSWQKTTRKDLLQMKFHQLEAHELPHVKFDIPTTKSIFSTLVAPLTMAFGFIKLMFPLTMLSVPIIWLFPWELITGGFDDSRKFFNDVSNSKKRGKSGNRLREDILWASTALNIVVSVIFGSGGGGGGGH